MRKSGLAAILSLLLTPLAAQQNDASAIPYSADFAEMLADFQLSLRWNEVQAVTVDTVDLWKKWSTVDNFTFGKNRGTLTMINDLDALHPVFRDKVRTLIAQCEAKGIHLAIVETFRTRAKQNEYRSMGKKYTRSSGGRSKHQYGLAVDVVPVKDTVAIWNNKALWRIIGTTGERLGLRWGGRWRHIYDPGHFEWSDGLNSSHLMAGQFPKMISEEYPCLEDDLELLSQNWNAWELEQAAVSRQGTPRSQSSR